MLIKDKMTGSISWWRTDFGEQEIQRVSAAIAAGHISQGPVTAEFETRVAQALDVPYVVATTSGSVAMLMALMALGIKRDDEVIIPNRTWIATAHAPMMLGAKVVLVDVLPDAPIMDVSQIRKNITSRTRAIIPVSLNGRSPAMDEIRKIAEEYGLFVMEDAAQGFFSKYFGTYIGTASDAGCFSLSIAKLNPTGQGGLVVTKNKQTCEKLRRIRTHGVDDVINCRFSEMGFNFRFTDLQAAIGIEKLNSIHGSIARVKEVYIRYEQRLKNFPFLELIPVSVEKGEIPIYVEVLCEEREKLISFLASHNIQTRPFYPDLNTASYLGACGEFPNAKRFGERGLFLPCGPGQSSGNIDRVIEVIALFGRKYHEAGHSCAK